MDAVILAAGLGTRLRPYTLQMPKPMLPVRGRPLLDWTLGALPPAVNRVVVVVNYLAEQIADYLGRQTHIAQWALVHQNQPRGTGDAVRSCRDQLRSENFLTLNGDDLYGAADLAALAPRRAGVLVHPVDQPRQFGVAFLKTDGTLERLMEKPDLDGPRLANTGAYVFPRDVFRHELTMSPRGEYEITQYVSALAQSGTVHVVQAKFWLPIGTVEAWREAEKCDLETVMKAQ
ncbi:MAG TPA: nucleotidyltransferase family protein [Gemmataceae bacterium]|nr:nucleotidyltransferase family protein [Gemmataceae bacterium]